MEPRIQYAKTSDGVNIAYWMVGEGDGLPLVWLPGPPFSHVQLSWRLSAWRPHYERVLARRPLVCLDFRGQGLSDRNIQTLSLDAYVLDLEAVADRLEFGAFAVQGVGHAAQVAIAYAVLHPRRVSHPILQSAYARAADLRKIPQLRGFGAILRRATWEMYVDAVAHVMYGWDPAGDAGELADFMRECSSPETARALADANASFDVSGLLSRVNTPTLVLHYRESIVPNEEMLRDLVSSIPTARLVTLEGRFGTAKNVDDYIRTVDDFLDERALHGFTSGLPQGTAVILFADIVDSTALTERLGDAAFRDKARKLDGALRSIIRDNGGTPIEGKLLGDGVLAVFTSARQAIEAALACGEQGRHAGLPLHLGLHAGDVIRESDPDGRSNVYGGAVNIASRISGLSAPGEVLVSETVRSLARTSAGVRFEDRGEQSLKGVGEAVRVWAVREGEA